jgi:hypothetical protein
MKLKNLKIEPQNPCKRVCVSASYVIFAPTGIFYRVNSPNVPCARVRSTVLCVNARIRLASGTPAGISSIYIKLFCFDSDDADLGKGAIPVRRHGVKDQPEVSFVTWLQGRG